MELFRALAALAEPPARELAPVADALLIGPLPDAHAYTELFIFQLYPYASVYLGAEGMIGGDARSLIAGFWRALGQSPPIEPDHLALMLALYARLRELEDEAGEPVRREGWHQARVTFLWEHLLSWLPVYLCKLETIAPPFYREWGKLLMEALMAEAMEALTALTAAAVEPAWLPLHLRESEGLIDPRAGGEVEEFLQSLLSPVRSGMILVRSDLTRAARSLNLGLRLGERAFIIKALFGQEPQGMLDWLAVEARIWAGRHRLGRERLGAVAEFWEQRAAACASLLEELKVSAGEKVSAGKS
jgi:TorA maturation chaperone TorD